MLYDRAYRLLYGLDRPMAQVGPALCVKVERTRRDVTLPDGTTIRRGEVVGVLHLNNARLGAVHLNGLAPLAIGLEFRRWLLASLGELARLAAAPRPLADVRAFTAITIFHRGLARLGFQVERGGLALPGLVAAYQRVLLACLHPAGPVRVRGARDGRARRLWLTREALLARYGAETGPGAPPASRRALRIAAEGAETFRLSR